jgi:hypothetical protein
MGGSLAKRLDFDQEVDSPHTASVEACQASEEAPVADSNPDLVRSADGKSR